MSRFEEYNRLIFGRTLGWKGGERLVVDLTPAERDVLVSLLTHWKTRMRWQAAHRLGRLGGGGATERLIASLADSHWLVRVHAVRALGRIGESAAAQPLIRALSDDCRSVRRRAVTALGRLKTADAEVTRVLVSLLKDPDKEVKRRAVLALAPYKTPWRYQRLAALRRAAEIEDLKGSSASATATILKAMRDAARIDDAIDNALEEAWRKARGSP